MNEIFRLWKYDVVKWQNNHVVDVEEEIFQIMVVVDLMAGHIMGRRGRYFAVVKLQVVKVEISQVMWD